MSQLRVAACQLNLLVGDLDGNVEAMLAALGRAEDEGCDLAVFPELAVTGYPPEDLLLKGGFVADTAAALAELAARTGRCAAVVGFVEAEGALYNAAAVCAQGRVHGVYRKRLLPNYSVFDEVRYFRPGEGDPPLFVVGDMRVGVTICEDAWAPNGPVADLAAGGADVVLSLNASPYYAGRLAERERMLATRAADAGCGLVYVNLVGGQDELVFDGASLAVDRTGQVAARAPQFREHLLVLDMPARATAATRRLPEVIVERPAPPHGADRTSATCVLPLPPDREVYEALVLGTRDYVAKNGFTDVVVGLSGGVDSSLVAVIAVDALGADHVHGVAMPSRFSSDGSLVDARRLATNLGIDFRVIPIEPAHEAFTSMLAPSFAGLAEGLAEENLQARIRGTTLMALSNKLGWLVLATGNKSEMAVGFSTLYGDLAGGFAVIKDVLKTLVYELCRGRNAWADLGEGRVPGPLIPESVLTKPPSAELRADQRDDQSLPPYDELDAVLEAYVGHDAAIAELEELGFERALVRRVVALVDRAEYKRRQAPPGVRVSAKAFGKDRRLPITTRYRG